MACAIMPLSLAICRSISCSLQLQRQHFPVHRLRSSRQSIDQLLLAALQPVVSQCRQFLGIGLALGQNPQNAKPAGAQQIADYTCHFQAVFRRLLPRLGYQSAVWAIAHRLCRVIWKILHQGVRFIEQGSESDPKVRKQRTRILARALRKLGYDVAITPINPAMA